MIEKCMTLKADLRSFLDDEGNELALTEQAKTVFKFLTKIVTSVSQVNYSEQSFSPINEQPLIDVDLKCNTRADRLSCTGNIKAKNFTIDIIEWHCNICEAAGTISHWQGSLWDKHKPTLH